MKSSFPGRSHLNGALLAVVLAHLMIFFGSSRALAGESDTEIDEGEGRPPWALSLSVGVSSPDDFTSIFTAPWNTSFEETGIIAVAGSRQLVELDENTWIDVELGLARRVGGSDHWEISGLAFLRWDGVPWKEWLYTSFGVGVGPSFATGVWETERRKSGNGEGSRTLNMLVPEIALALPDHPTKQLVFKLHHRSGIFGLINGVSGGSTFVTVGGRVRF